MTRKRLRKNINKNFGAKKRDATLSKCWNADNAIFDKIAGRQSTQQQLKNVDASDEQRELQENTSAGNFNVPSILARVDPPIPRPNIFRSQIRFRCVKNRIQGRELNDHNEVWYPMIVEQTSDDIETNSCGLTGLSNLGNTCYMNAAVQALSNCPPFSEFFRSIVSTAPFSSKDGHETPLARSFRCLIQQIWSEDCHRSVSPQDFLMQIRYSCPQFRAWMQQDTQEFIRCFLELLHRELRQPVYEWEYRDLKRYPSISTNGTPDSNQAEMAIGDSPHPSGISTRSNSRSSDEDFYETADSGWSSDAENPTTSKSVLPGVSNETSKHDRTLTNNTLHTPNESIAENLRGEEPSSFIGWRSLVTEVFDGQLRSVVKCLTCHHLSETYETFQDLSLSIPTLEQLDHMDASALLRDEDEVEEEDTESDEARNVEANGWKWPWWLSISWLRSLYRYLFGESVSLNDVLTSFFLPDDLRGDNMYSCEHCAKLRNGVKICKIMKTPEILCIHLKKFRHDLSYPTKVKTRINFPIYDLDLSPFIASSEKAKCANYYYDLCAFISHFGNSAESGHYVAYCKNAYDGNWYEYDDAKVTRMEVAEVLTKEAYVLFYQRQTRGDVDKVKSKVKELLDQEAEEREKAKVSTHYYISREWLHRLSTFSHPGPISNHDFLCEHAQILPRRAARLSEYYATIGGQLWEFLHEKFGGGPVSIELHYCLLCQNQHQFMRHKRETELQTFMALDARVKTLKEILPEATYGNYLPPNAISKSWMDCWRAFINGDELEPPSAIDNSKLLSRNPKDSTMRLRGTHYVPLPRELWLFLLSIYGGGPEVLCVNCVQPTSDLLAKILSDAEKKIARNYQFNEAYEIFSGQNSTSATGGSSLSPLPSEA